MANELLAWLIGHQIKVLNMAGNRGSSLSSEQMQEYRTILYDALTGTQRLAVLFIKDPTSWGLRGDPYLWHELKQTAQTLLLPGSTAELKELILLLVRNLIGEDITTGKEVKVPRFQYGGMSSGMVSADYWIEEAIPLLRHRLILLQEGSL